MACSVRSLIGLSRGVSEMRFGDFGSLFMVLSPGDQLPLSLAVGFWLCGCVARTAYRLGNGQGRAGRPWGESKVDPLPAGAGR